MTSTLLLFDLLGAAALLLWGLRLIKTGVNTAFGVPMRRFISASVRNRFVAFGAGFVTTLALQSSTAMAVILGSFVSQGLVGVVMAQSVMLGANLGTAVVATALSFDLHWLAPVAILVGVIANGGRSRRHKGASEIAIGIGLMFLSLRLMAEATEPMRQSEALTAFFGLLGDAPLVAILLSACFAAVSASSLAVVLFVMSLSSAGAIDAQLCILLIAGANVGGALPPIFAVAADGASARQVVVGNLGVRGLGALALLVSATSLASLLPSGTSIPQLAIYAHLAFNFVLAAIFLPIVGTFSRIVGRLLPVRPGSNSDDGPKHLDEAALVDPPSALAAATRETLRVGDAVEEMLETTLSALKADDEILCQGVIKLDDKVDRLQGAIKLYLARMERSGLDSVGQRQLNEILAYAVNLEHIGDIIERSLTRLTIKKIEKQLSYSKEGMDEIEELFRDTIDNLQLAQNVFISRDSQIARRLMEAKVPIRQKEKRSVERHMDRLQQRQPETLQTTSMHMDVLRDLKRINGHLMSVAAPILEEAGLLRESRLKKG